MAGRPPTHPPTLPPCHPPIPVSLRPFYPSLLPPPHFLLLKNRSLTWTAAASPAPSPPSFPPATPTSSRLTSPTTSSAVGAAVAAGAGAGAGGAWDGGCRIRHVVAAVCPVLPLDPPASALPCRPTACPTSSNPHPPTGGLPKEIALNENLEQWKVSSGSGGSGGGSCGSSSSSSGRSGRWAAAAADDSISPQPAACSGPVSAKHPCCQQCLPIGCGVLWHRCRRHRRHRLPHLPVLPALARPCRWSTTS